MATYDKTKIPTTVPNRVESLIVFFVLLFRRLMGNLTVVEQPGEIPTPSVLASEVDATDGNKYLILRVRLRVASDYLDVAQAAWVSTPDSIAPSALPAGYGGI
jgi:hypothetical protein